MNFRYVSDGFHLDRKDMFGREAPVPSWLRPDSLQPFSIDTGDNSAVNGGDGYFSGSMVHPPVAVFDPVNIAVAGFHGAADAHQSNTVEFHQGASQAAGGGGHGGNGNAAIGGDVSAFGGAGSPAYSIIGAGHASDHGWVGSDVSASGDNHA